MSSDDAGFLTGVGTIILGICVGKIYGAVYGFGTIGAICLVLGLSGLILNYLRGPNEPQN